MARVGDPAIGDAARVPPRYASGANLAPICPCCGHIASVRGVAGLIPRHGRDPYGVLAIIFRQDYLRNSPSYTHPIVAKGLRDQGFAIAAAPTHRWDLRHLYPPERPATPWQRLDRRLALIIDLAFAGLALFFVGWLVRASELVGVAALIGALALLAALWLALALRTGRFARTSAAAQTSYERALRRWEALFYCEDCGSVFRRDRHGYLRPEAVPGYLRREGEDVIDDRPAGR